MPWKPFHPHYFGQDAENSLAPENSLAQDNSVTNGHVTDSKNTVRQVAGEAFQDLSYLAQV